MWPMPRSGSPFHSFSSQSSTPDLNHSYAFPSLLVCTKTDDIAIPLDPSIHVRPHPHLSALTDNKHIQEPNNHPHSIRRSPLVRRIRNRSHPRRIRSNGRIIGHRRMGRYFKYFIDFGRYCRCGSYFWCRGASSKWGYWIVECWVFVDGSKLSCFRCLCTSFSPIPP